jgi:inosose dehydratase
VHLKDVDRSLAEGVASGKLGYEEAVRRGVFKPLGDGDVETERVIETLEKSGYEGWYVLEQDVMLNEKPVAGGGPKDNVARSLAYLMKVMQ